VVVIILKALYRVLGMARQIDKKDNFFSIEVTEGEQITVQVGEEGTGGTVVLLAPYSGFLNCYLKRDTSPIHYKE